MKVGLTAIWAGACFHTHQGGRRHLAARHTVDCVVDEDDDDVVATIQRVDGLGRTDAGKIAVALIGKHEVLRPQTFGRTCDGWCTPVGGLYPVDVDVVVGKHSTPHRRDAYGAFLKPHLLDDFGNELVHHTVATSRAVVHRRVVEQLRLPIYEVLGLYDILVYHSLL